MWRDVRWAARALTQAKGWAAAIIASLALGIGANTVLFSAVNGLLLRKVAVSDPDALVRFRYAGPNDMRTDVLLYGFSAPDARGRPVEATFSYPMYRQFLADNQTLSDLFAFAPIGTVNVVVGDDAQVASGLFVSGNYHRALGVAARLGRTIVPDDDRASAAPVAVISHKYWMSRFGGRSGAVGAVARVNNVPVTVVGVLPESFSGVDRAISDPPDITVPLALEPRINLQPSTLQSSLLGAANFWWLNVMGRLRAGVTAEQAQANFAGVFQQAARAGFDAFLSGLPAAERSKSYLQDHHDVPELLVDSGRRGVYDANAAEVREVIGLEAVVALVLLIVCANVANLMLSRATAREKDLSIRVALGASRGRLVRQLLTECVLLAAIGGALGVVAAQWGRHLLPAVTAQHSALDWRVLAWVAALSVATGLLFGVVPAVRASRTDVTVALKAGSRSLIPSRSLAGKMLVVAQVTISLVLLVGAGLFLRTLDNLRRTNVGFNAHNVLLFRISPALNRYDSQTQDRLYERIGERLRAIPDVRQVAWSNPALMGGRRFSTPMFVQGRTGPRGTRDTVAQMIVSPTFFETMQIPIVAGRGFMSIDRQGAPAVAVINEAALHKYFAGEPALGRHVGSSPEDSGRLEIVGIVRDAKYTSVREPAVPTMYRSSLQASQWTMTFEVRTGGEPLAIAASVRNAVKRIDPSVPIVDMTTQTDAIERGLGQERLFAEAYTAFGTLALTIAAVGLFGLMSYSVARRTSEIGVRMALGAERRDVVRLVMRESMALVVAGIAFGIVGAVAMSRLVASQLFEIGSTDSATIAGAVVLMLIVASAASYAPARRAARVDPLVALRYE